MIKKVFCLMASFIAFYGSQAQIFFEKKSDVLYILEKSSDEVTCIDSLSTLDIFSDYSYHVNDHVIYLVWSSSSFHKKTYYINTYRIEDYKKVTLHKKYWISETEYELLFKNGLVVSTAENGLSLDFENGKISTLTISYSDWSFLTFSKLIADILELIER